MLGQVQTNLDVDSITYQPRDSGLAKPALFAPFLRLPRREDGDEEVRFQHASWQEAVPNKCQLKLGLREWMTLSHGQLVLDTGNLVP